MTVVEIGGPSEKRLQTTVCGLCGAQQGVDYKQFSTHLAKEHTFDDLQLEHRPSDPTEKSEVRCDGGEEISQSADGIVLERRGPQLVSPLTSRQKSASPHVHSGATPIGCIVPSDLSVAENKAPQERHFAKHRGAESGSDIAALDILSWSTNGRCDSPGNWIEDSSQSLLIDIEDDSVSGSKKTTPSPGLAYPTTDRDHTERCYDITGLYGTLLSHGFARFEAGRQDGGGRCQHWPCRPLKRFVNRKIIVLSNITPTSLPFTGTGFPHLIASQHYLYTKYDCETTIGNWLGPGMVVTYFQGFTRLNIRAVNTDTDRSIGGDGR